MCGGKDQSLFPEENAAMSVRQPRKLGFKSAGKRPQLSLESGRQSPVPPQLPFEAGGKPIALGESRRRTRTVVAHPVDDDPPIAA